MVDCACRELLNLCEVGRDGKVPFQRLRGRKMHPELIEFGERVMFQPLDHKSLGSAQPRWSEGVFVGIRMHTGEKLVATENGVCKTRSIRRRVEAERWDSEEITKVTGTPWKPYIHSEDDKLLTRAPQPALDKAEDGRDQVKEVDDNVVPRSFAILRKDLVNHGYYIPRDAKAVMQQPMIESTNHILQHAETGLLRR